MIVNRLPHLMEQKKVSIRQLSRDTGITYTTIRAVYHGERRSIQLEVLDAICEALNVQPGDIYIQQPPGTSTTLITKPPIEKERPATDGDILRPTTKKNDDDWKSW